MHINAYWHGSSWIVEVIAIGTQEGKPFQVTHRFITRAETLNQLGGQVPSSSKSKSLGSPRLPWPAITRRPQ